MCGLEGLEEQRVLPGPDFGLNRTELPSLPSCPRPGFLTRCWELVPVPVPPLGIQILAQPEMLMRECGKTGPRSP